jgi:hypothetical protein
MGIEQRAREKAIREARLSIVSRTADALAKLVVELGPCHAVTVAFTMPAADQGEEEGKSKLTTHAFSGWFDPNIAAAHYAEASDVLNRQHVELQKKLDEEELERRKAGAEGIDGPPGVVVEHDPETA